MKTPDYSNYIKKSFELVKKNKWLWIFGALVGTGGGFSLNSVFDTFKNLNPKEKTPPDILKAIPEKTANVLGSYTSALQDWFYSIPAYKWFLFVILIFAVIVIGMIVSLIIRNWARGSLIAGIEMAEKGHMTNLKNTSSFGFKYLKNLILLSLWLLFIGICLTVITPLIWTVIFLIFRNIMIFKVLWIVVGVLTILVITFVGLIMLTLVNIYSERLIVLKDMAVIDAIKMSIKISKETFLSAILMGIINKVIAAAAGIVSLIILGIIIGIPSYLAFRSFETKPAFSIMLITFTAMSFVIFIFVSTVINSALATFNFSNWNQLFNDYFKEKSQ